MTRRLKGGSEDATTVFTLAATPANSFFGS